MSPKTTTSAIINTSVKQYLTFFVTRLELQAAAGLRLVKPIKKYVEYLDFAMAKVETIKLASALAIVMEVQNGVSQSIFRAMYGALGTTVTVPFADLVTIVSQIK
jgi:hypothetical protein